ncbi:MAG: DNA-binding protein, partial [Candidatus Woykebacteria bacterium GWB1_45_5]
MLKVDIIEKVAKEAHLTKKAAKEAVDSTFDNIISALKKSERVVVSGFGTFVIRGRRARAGR